MRPLKDPGWSIHDVVRKRMLDGLTREFTP
jgi:hypothetical protein